MLIDPVSDCCGATVTIMIGQFSAAGEICDICELFCNTTRFNTELLVEVK